MDHCFQNTTPELCTKQRQNRSFFKTLKTNWKSEWYFFDSSTHTSKIDSCPPPVAANLLSQISKDMAMFEGVSIAVSNKAASAQDIKSARAAFDVLEKTDLEGDWSRLLCTKNHSVVVSWLNK